MEYSWQYPIYLIPHGTGYASIVDPATDDPPTQLLVVHTGRDAAETFMRRFDMLGAPRALKSDREFRWLLQSLRDPVTQVAFDPEPRESDVNSPWVIAVHDLIANHLTADFSPWNYPVFAIEQEVGFACIEGASSDGRSIIAIGIFSSREKAESYLNSAEESGQPRELTNLNDTRGFLETLANEVVAVALDPLVADGRRAAKHCFAIDTLLNKYLVLEPPSEDEA